MIDPFAGSTSTALIVTDVQNDFASPRGSLSVEGGEEIIGPINETIVRVRTADRKVVYTQDWHPRSTPHFAKDGGIWPVHCVQGTWGSEFHPELLMDGEVVRKGAGGEDGYSGFSMRDPLTGHQTETVLRSMLRARGVRRIVLTGIATDYCVKESALDGLRFGFEVFVLADLVRGVELEPGDGERALAVIADAGATIIR